MTVCTCGTLDTSKPGWALKAGGGIAHYFDGTPCHEEPTVELVDAAPIRAIHRCDDVNGSRAACVECFRDYPCPTLRALQPAAD